MNYVAIISEIQDRLNMNTPDSITRIGRAINRRYKAITSSLGLETTRRTVLQATTTPGVNTLTFEGSDKLLSIVDRSVTPYKILDEVSIYELKDLEFTGRSTPTKWAILTVTADSVTAQLDCIPQAELTFYADALLNLATLTGQLEPVIPESFCDVLIWGALADEYRKLEKPALARDAEDMYDRRLSDLKMYIATSARREIYQGKIQNPLFGTSSSGSSAATSINGSSSYTQTGLVNFDRSSAGPDSPPFHVSSDSTGLVENLNAEFLNGHDSTYFNNAANLFGTLPAVSGAGLLNLNASELTLGTIPDGRFPTTLPAVSGLNLTNLNASALTAGTIPDARFPGILPALSGVNLTNLNATNLGSGTIPDGRFPALLPAVSGANLTSLNATNLGSGTVPFIRLPRLFQPLNVTIASVANVGVGETDLITYSLPGGTLSTTNDRVRIRAWGVGAANVNLKTFKIYFGSTVVITANTVSAVSSPNWFMTAEVIRTGAATQIALGTWDAIFTGAQINNTTPAETLSGAITIKITGQSNTAGGDITSRGMIVDLIPAP